MPIAIPHSSFDSIVQANWVWSVNGKRASDRKSGALADRFESEDESAVFYSPWERGLLCEYCNTPMETPTFRRESGSSDDWNLERCYSLANCPYCCHWRFRAGEGTDACMDAPTSVIAESVAKKFDTDLPEGCATELALASEFVADVLGGFPSCRACWLPTNREESAGDISSENPRVSSS